MARKASRTAELRQFLIRNVRAHPRDLVAVAMAEFDVSREWATRVLKQLVREGVLQTRGKTKGIQYSLVQEEHRRAFRVTAETEEYALWREFMEPVMRDLAANVKEICLYGFTEMVNNVIDHSKSEVVMLTCIKSADRIRILVMDEGIGIFVKIQTEMGLDSTKHAVFELSKGKFTTDASRHTGEGVFFTSRAFDHFNILSSSLAFAHTRDADDWLLEDRQDEAIGGTSIAMTIDPASTCTLDEVFQKHSVDPDEAGFTKTRLVLKLAQYADGPLISRSQAKRVLAGIHRFKEVVIDFAGVDSVGPAFADEIFRVYKLAHPDIQIIPINMNERSTKMVRRVLDP
jgi:hypothetical protein